VRLVVVATCLFVAFGSAPAIVSAASPGSSTPAATLPAVLTQQLTDNTGLLANDADAINAALQQLYDATGVHLYVVFVDSTGATKISDYAVAVGESSNLGPRDAVLVVAVSDQTDLISLRPDLVATVSQAELDQVRVKTLETKLSTGDYGDAVVETANQLADVFGRAVTSSAVTSTEGAQESVAQESEAAPAATPAPADSTPTSGTSPSVLTVAALLLLLIGVVLIVGRTMRRRPPTGG
jgi:uncharacterized membrane protein YgcG